MNSSLKLKTKNWIENVDYGVITIIIDEKYNGLYNKFDDIWTNKEGDFLNYVKELIPNYNSLKNKYSCESYNIESIYEDIREYCISSYILDHENYNYMFKRFTYSKNEISILLDDTYKKLKDYNKCTILDCILNVLLKCQININNIKEIELVNNFDKCLMELATLTINDKYNKYVKKYIETMDASKKQYIIKKIDEFKSLES
jgi:hypothetical protein